MSVQVAIVCNRCGKAFAQGAADRDECYEAAAVLGDHVPALLAEVRKLKALLREVEWSAVDEYGGGLVCPVCDAPSPGSDPGPGHRPDCELAAVIR